MSERFTRERPKRERPRRERPRRERLKNIAVVAISVVALGVIVFGITTEPPVPPTVKDRIAAISDAIMCPFCDGETLANSQSGAARDFRVLIAERIEEGASNEEIIDDFARTYGDAFILDASTSAWLAVLWVVPIAAMTLGGGVLVIMKRATLARRGT